MDMLLNHILPRQDISEFSKAAWASYQVSAIHPFSDGNGRLSRIFINWVLHGAQPHHQRLPFSIVLCRNGAHVLHILAHCGKPMPLDIFPDLLKSLQIRPCVHGELFITQEKGLSGPM